MYCSSGCHEIHHCHCTDKRLFYVAFNDNISWGSGLEWVLYARQLRRNNYKIDKKTWKTISAGPNSPACDQKFTHVFFLHKDDHDDNNDHDNHDDAAAHDPDDDDGKAC